MMSIDYMYYALCVIHLFNVASSTLVIEDTTCQYSNLSQSGMYSPVAVNN